MMRLSCRRGKCTKSVMDYTGCWHQTGKMLRDEVGNCCFDDSYGKAEWRDLYRGTCLLHIR